MSHQLKAEADKTPIERSHAEVMDRLEDFFSRKHREMDVEILEPRSSVNSEVEEIETPSIKTEVEEQAEKQPEQKKDLGTEFKPLGDMSSWYGLGSMLGGLVGQGGAIGKSAVIKIGEVGKAVGGQLFAWNEQRKEKKEKKEKKERKEREEANAQEEQNNTPNELNVPKDPDSNILEGQKKTTLKISPSP